ncbi:mechanosensitive ion channel family protein [Chitinophaga sp. Cy-1792]|uniref:mechanosensitive ion channel family protein n=1 Tax=Chitinophaga sp. Cy-1792 TaxID=2608339 RepID=UPI001421D5A4|nr:mechanosensitive ion channel family protein [Chitinophaga sp. Cy-1792]NIG54915.1 mechanosensitive ion channel family protein [Chitinophaga sp. Cy-1792]
MNEQQITSYGTLVYNKLHGWLTTTVEMLPNFVVAIIVFILFYLLARFIRTLTYKFSQRLSSAPAVSNLIASLVYIIFLMMGLFISLNILNLDKAVTSLLAGAGIIGLALGFAFQDLTANFISGLFITFKKPFAVGQVIETNGFKGTVDEIELRSTTMVTDDGLRVIIPNKDIFQKPIINHSLTPLRRIVLTFGMPPTQQTDQAEAIINRIVAEIPGVQADKAKTAWFTGMDIATKQLLITVTCWVDSQVPDAYPKTVHLITSQVISSLKGANLM